MVVLVCSLATPALAAPATASARYDEGKRAYDAGDFASATSAFAEADALTPNAAVLELAMSSAVQANDPIHGMGLVERADQRGLTGLADTGRRTFGDKVGRIDVACPGAARCAAQVDGRSVSVTAPSWYVVGEHALTLAADGNEERFTISVMAEQITIVRPTRLLKIAPTPTPAPLPPPKPTEPERLPPRWFFGAAGATAALGIATSMSAADMYAKHAAFAREPANTRAADEGHAAQTRTNVLLVSTIVVAVGTLALGTIFTRWHTNPNPEVAHAF